MLCTKERCDQACCVRSGVMIFWAEAKRRAGRQRKGGLLRRILNVHNVNINAKKIFRGTVLNVGNGGGGDHETRWTNTNGGSE